jgi:hypothetical protein
VRLPRRSPERLTQRLSSAVFTLSPQRRQRAAWVLALAVLIGLAGGWYLHDLRGVSGGLDPLRQQQEIEILQRQLKLGELRLQQELATREELARQIDAQTQALREAEQELNFFRSQRGKSVAK